jgi:tryptophan-rich hypothetical protein
MANQINPKKLLNSKWTHIHPKGKERHFIISKLVHSDSKEIIECQLEAIINNKIYLIDWQQLKDNQQWLMGWK